MFYGPPGNGKTKMVRVLASRLNYQHICSLNLEHEHITTANIHKLIRDTPDNSIILIEDITKNSHLMTKFYIFKFTRWIIKLREKNICNNYQ